MSYDISLMCECGCKHCTHEYFDTNYTSNIAPMMYEANEGIGAWDKYKTAGDLIPSLAKTIDRLEMEPDKYRAMNPDNGWGDYDRMLKHFLKPLLEACINNPKAKLWVSR